MMKIQRVFRRGTGTFLGVLRPPRMMMLSPQHESVRKRFADQSSLRPPVGGEKHAYDGLRRSPRWPWRFTVAVKAVAQHGGGFPAGGQRRLPWRLVCLHGRGSRSVFPRRLSWTRFAHGHHFTRHVYYAPYYTIIAPLLPGGGLRTITDRGRICRPIARASPPLAHHTDYAIGAIETMDAEINQAPKWGRSDLCMSHNNLARPPSQFLKFPGLEFPSSSESPAATAPSVGGPGTMTRPLI